MWEVQCVRVCAWVSGCDVVGVLKGGCGGLWVLSANFWVDEDTSNPFWASSGVTRQLVFKVFTTQIFTIDIGEVSFVQ